MSAGFERGLRVLRERGPRAALRGGVDEVRARLEQRRLRHQAPQTFTVGGVEHVQLVHLHNRTWRNERAVEVPLALAFLERQGGPVLEVGNVLGGYGRRGHVVVDKYERRPGVRNVDIVDYRPDERYGAIVSISTIEHVGWDEEPRDGGKVGRTLLHLRHLLRADGRLFVTAPLTYNPHLDTVITQGPSGMVEEAFLLSDQGRWAEVDRATAFAKAMVGPHGASAIWAAELSP